MPGGKAAGEGNYSPRVDHGMKLATDSLVKYLNAKKDNERGKIQKTAAGQYRADRTQHGFGNGEQKARHRAYRTMGIDGKPRKHHAT